MKIKLLNSGGFDGLRKVKFPVVVQADQLYAGFIVDGEELKKIIPPHRHGGLTKNYVFFPDEVEVVEE